MSTAPDYTTLCKIDAQGLSGQLEGIKPGKRDDEMKKAQTSIASWNRDVEFAHRELQGEITESIKNLLPSGYTRESLAPATATLLDRYAVADALALHVQSQLSQVSRTVLLLACGGLICFELTHCLGHLPFEYSHLTASLMMSAFFLAWCVAIYLDRTAHQSRIQERYQDYRVLAEGLRVQFYWQWAGLKEKASEAYPKRQREHLLWLRYALGLWMPAPEAKNAEPKTVLGAWIKNQHDYFLGSDGKSGEVERNGRLNEECRSMGQMSLYAGVVLGGVTAGLMWLGHSLLPSETLHYVEALLLLLVGLGIVGAAACYAWRERFAYAEHVKNYTAMANIYQEAKLRMEEQKIASETILVDLGHEALAESTEWLMLHRERHVTEARL